MICKWLRKAKQNLSFYKNTSNSANTHNLSKTFLLTNLKVKVFVSKLFKKSPCNPYELHGLFCCYTWCVYYFTSSKTTLTDYQCVSTGCCTHVAKTEITIDNQHVTKSPQRYRFLPKQPKENTEKIKKSDDFPWFGLPSSSLPIFYFCQCCHFFSSPLGLSKNLSPNFHCSHMDRNCYDEPQIAVGYFKKYFRYILYI